MTRRPVIYSSRSISRTVLSVSCLTIVAISCALPEYLEAFNKKYSIKSGSYLGKSKCVVCHSSKDGGERNLYGKDVEAALKKLKHRGVDDEVLKSVEPLDSNKNGIKNLDEILADHLPGKVAK